MLGTILVNVDVITLGIGVGTDIGSLDGSFYGYNDGKLEVLFIGDFLASNDGKVLGYDEGVNWDYLMVKLLVLYLEMYMESHLGLMLEQSWDF